MPKSKESLKIRLQKAIADCGVTSRRKAEQMILEGRVEVNGQVITSMGVKVNPHEDSISVDGKVIDFEAIDLEYIVLK